MNLGSKESAEWRRSVPGKRNSMYRELEDTPSLYSIKNGKENGITREELGEGCNATMRESL